MEKHQSILNLNEAGLADIELVGGKNASLGEMLQNLLSGLSATIAYHQPL